MTNRRPRRRYRKAQGRSIWVFSDPNYALKPERVTRIITKAGLEQARLEADAQAEAAGRRATTTAPDESEEANHV